MHQVLDDDSNSVGSMKEPKIMKMDWRSLGYWPVYKDGKLTWERDPEKND